MSPPGEDVGAGEHFRGEAVFRFVQGGGPDRRRCPRASPRPLAMAPCIPSGYRLATDSSTFSCRFSPHTGPGWALAVSHDFFSLVGAEGGLLDRAAVDTGSDYFWAGTSRTMAGMEASTAVAITELQLAM